MISTFAIVIAALFAQAALASPLADTSLLPLSPTTLRARDPLQLALARGGTNASTAARAAPAALAARQEFPAHLLLCTAANCETGTCGAVGGIDLSEFPTDVCFPAAPSFNSVAVVQPSGEGLPFAVLVGPPGCEEFADIPVVNECFNIEDGPWDQWELFDGQ